MESHDHMPGPGDHIPPDAISYFYIAVAEGYGFYIKGFGVWGSLYGYNICTDQNPQPGPLYLTRYLRDFGPADQIS